MPSEISHAKRESTQTGLITRERGEGGVHWEGASLPTVLGGGHYRIHTGGGKGDWDMVDT